MANYLSLIYTKDQRRISFSEMKNIFPNHRDFVMFPEKYIEFDVPTKYIKLANNHYIKRVGYNDFLFGHDNYEYFSATAASKIIHLYRNPLDMAVSYYYFGYKNRNNIKYEDDKKLEMAITHLIKLYIPHYIFIKNFSKTSRKIIRISYESLSKNPLDTCLILFQWLNFPINILKLRTALNNASIKEAREEEKKTGRAVFMPPSSTFTGSFVRSGEIGQWKEHFTSSEIQILTRFLKKYNILLDEFILE